MKSCAHDGHLGKLLERCSAPYARAESYRFEEDEFSAALAEIQRHKHYHIQHEGGEAWTQEYAEGLAAYNLITHPDRWQKVEKTKRAQRFRVRRTTRNPEARTQQLLEDVRHLIALGCGLVLALILIILGLALFAGRAQGQNVTIQGVKKGTTNGSQLTVTCTDANHCAADVNITPNSPLPTGSNTIGAVTGNVASGTTDSGNPIKVGGVFNATLPTVTTGQRVDAQSDSNGRAWIKQYQDTTTASYYASGTVAPAASATDIAVIAGAATTQVLVNRVEVTCSQTTAGLVTLKLIRRSIADTLGTSTATTIGKDDTAYGAPVAAAPLLYTANPTLGTTDSTVYTSTFGCGQSSTPQNDTFIWKPLKPLLLRGTAQQLVVNLNGVTVTGGSFNVTYNWEETTTP